MNSSITTKNMTGINGNGRWSGLGESKDFSIFKGIATQAELSRVPDFNIAERKDFLPKANGNGSKKPRFEHAVASRPVLVMLGFLRVIPVHNRQRALDVFGCYYGLNGHQKGEIKAVAKHWRISLDTVAKIVTDIWQKLVIARSPISTHTSLESAMRQVRALENLIGERVPMSPIIPDTNVREKILTLFVDEELRIKCEARARRYQMGLNLSPPLAARTQAETMLHIVCSIFGVTMAEIRSMEDLTDRVVRARHIAMYLLYLDLGLEMRTVCRMLNRERLLFCHGKNQIGSMIEEGNGMVIQSVETIRRLYKKTIVLWPTK